MKKQLIFTLIVMLAGMTALNAHPVDAAKAKAIGQKFVSANFNNNMESSELQLVYTGVSDRSEACFYAFNVGQEGFVIVSADDRFRPIVGYSDEGPFETENMSPELEFYLGKIIEARTSRAAVLDDRTAEEWQSVTTTGMLLSRNGGRGVDYICTTKWDQDSPYNLYAPEASGGPGGRCYAGCVATAMSQVMKRWNHPLQGTGSHSYYCWGYGNLSANFGNTTYDWDNMPDRLGGASQEEIEAVALLMYHCGIAVDMDFGPDGSGANSWDVPSAIRQHFSYSNDATLRGREDYTLLNWQNMLKESFDLGWPVYYSGFNESGGHAFVCDGYDDDDLFHFNWGWGGNSDGWFVIDEIDYASWAQAVFNFVPTDVYNYMPMAPTNLTVTPGGDFDYSATIQWTNPTQNIHSETLTSIDQIVVTRNGETIFTQDNVTPGTTMSYTDHYLPAIVDYGVYVVVHNALSHLTVEKGVLLGPTCTWTVEMNSSDNQGWHGGSLSFVNAAGEQVAQVTLESASSTQSVTLPLGHVDLIWNRPAETVDNIKFTIKNSVGATKVAFDGAPSELGRGLFYIANNTCDSQDDESNGPTALSVQIAGNRASLSWEAPVGLDVVNYHVYRDNLLLDVTTERGYTDDQDLEVFHSYYVTAFTDHGETIASNTVGVAPESACAIPTNLRYEITATNKIQIMWDAPDDVTPTGYYLYRRVKGENFKRIKLLNKTYYTDNSINQLSDNFEYAVAAYFQAEDCVSGYATTQDNPEQNYIQVNKTIIPQHLDCTVQNGHVVLRWDEAIMAEAYNVYRDGQLIGESNEAEFIDEEASSPNSYAYTVTGKTASLESNPSNVVYVDWTMATDENGINQNVAIYPNPTEDRVTIEGMGLRQVRIINMIGQEVYNQFVSQDRIFVDLTAYPVDFYFIEVVSEQGVEVNKILKIK